LEDPVSDLSAYQDLMTALVTRRPGQSAAEDECVVLAALAKHAHELAEKIRQDETVMGESGDQYALLYADLIDPGGS
jgi:hypothetical protein